MRKICRFFNAEVWKYGKPCAAGVNVRELVGGSNFGWLIRTPCSSTNEPLILCPKKNFLSEKEIQAGIEKADKKLFATAKAINLIKEITGARPTWETWDENGEDMYGDIGCPACGNTLHYRVAGGNQQISGECLTNECLKFMM